MLFSSYEGYNQHDLSPLMLPSITYLSEVVFFQAFPTMKLFLSHVLFLLLYNLATFCSPYLRNRESSSTSLRIEYRNYLVFFSMENASIFPIFCLIIMESQIIVLYFGLQLNINVFILLLILFQLRISHFQGILVLFIREW